MLHQPILIEPRDTVAESAQLQFSPQCPLAASFIDSVLVGDLDPVDHKDRHLDLAPLGGPKYAPFHTRAREPIGAAIYLQYPPFRIRGTIRYATAETFRR